MVLRNIPFVVLISFYLNVNAQAKTVESSQVSKKQVNFIFTNAFSRSELDSVDVFILNEAKVLRTFNSGSFGNLTVFIEPGTYVVTFKRRAYKEKEFGAFKIPEKGVGIIRIGLIPME